MQIDVLPVVDWNTSCRLSPSRIKPGPGSVEHPSGMFRY
jgi:hypothetical protein